VGCVAYTLYPSGMIATLHTGRLLLQPLRLADAEQTQRLFPQWEIVQFMTTLIPWPYPAGVALDLAVAGITGRSYVSGRLLSEIWEITADEWRARRQGLRNILSAKERL
jgi:hypothetical protein